MICQATLPKSLYLRTGTTYFGIRLNHRPSWVLQILRNQISLKIDPFILLRLQNLPDIRPHNTKEPHAQLCYINLGTVGLIYNKRISSRLSRKTCFLRRLNQSHRGETRYIPGTQYSCIHHPIGAPVTG